MIVWWPESQPIAFWSNYTAFLFLALYPRHPDTVNATYKYVSFTEIPRATLQCQSVFTHISIQVYTFSGQLLWRCLSVDLLGWNIPLVDSSICSVMNMLGPDLEPAVWNFFSTCRSVLYLQALPLKSSYNPDEGNKCVFESKSLF